MNPINNQIYALVKQAKSEIKSYLSKHGSITLENSETDVDFYTSYFGNDGCLNSSQILLIELDNGWISVKLEDCWWISESEMDINLVMDILSIIELQENKNKQSTSIHPKLKDRIDDFINNTTPESILDDCEKMGIKTYPIEGISYQFRRSGQTFWEDMADKDDWRFVEQFLPKYHKRDDVAFADDLACVIEGGHEYKDLEWLQRIDPDFSDCTLDDIRKIQAQWDYELFQESEGNLQAMIQLGSIEVREFQTSIVSARILRDGDEDCVVLQCADITSCKYGTKIKVPASELQNVRTRELPDYDPEINDDWQIQVYYVNKASGDAFWCNAMNIDFE